MLDLDECIGEFGPTLLEESFGAHKEEICLEVRALLEVLLEELCPTQAPPIARTTVSLEQAVPVTQFQSSCLALSAIVPCSAGNETLDWLDCDMSEILQDAKVPLGVRTLLVNVRLWHEQGLPVPQMLEVYTDGSATTSTSHGRPCSWAIAVWAVCCHSRFLVGHSAAPAAPEGTPFHLGESQQCALTGELLALCWSLAWTCEFAERFGVPVKHLYDAKSAGEGVFGCCTAPVTDASSESPFARLFRLATALRQLASTRVALLHGYVAGHSGNIGNELVDQLAKRARRLPDDPWSRCLPDWPSRLAKHPLLLWTWALSPCSADVPCLYSFETEALRQQCLDLQPWKAPTQGVKHTTFSEGDLSVELCLFSYNVLTLLEKTLSKRVQPSDSVLDRCPTGMRIFGRLSKYQPHIIGLQETRLPNSVSQPDSDYHIFTSSADSKGNGGCALWLSKSRPYAFQGQSSFRFLAEQVTVISESPRIPSASCSLGAHSQAPFVHPCRSCALLSCVYAAGNSGFLAESMSGSPKKTRWL